MNPRVAVSVTAAVVLLAAAAHGTTVRPMNLEEMVQNSGAIFLGECTGAQSGRDDRGLPSTTYTFRVLKSVRGAAGKTVTIKQFGLKDIDLRSSQVFQVPGMPAYEPGRRYLLFLTQESSHGFCAPVGLMQGALRVFEQPGRATLAVNSVGNANLFRGLQDRSDLQRHASLTQTKGPVALDALLVMTTELVQRRQP